MEITTGPVKMKNVFSDNWTSFNDVYPECVDENIETNVQKVINCRNPKKMGFAAYQCPNCPNNKLIIPHTCKSRICNTCGALRTEQWVESRCNLLPNASFYHVTFTIDEELRQIFKEVPELLDCLFTASKDVMYSFYKEDKGIIPAIISVIHTFGRSINWNPHIHMIISAGGIHEETEDWVNIDFVPFKMLPARWKVFLLNTMKQKIQDILVWDPDHPKLKRFLHKGVLKDFFHEFYSMNWYVHIKPTRVDVKETVRYVGRYTQRLPIAETNLIRYTTDTITYIYKDHRDNQAVEVTDPIELFIKKLIQHIPQRYSHNIRHYGLMASRSQQKYLPILKKIKKRIMRWVEKLPWRKRQKKYTGSDPMICKKCHAEMKFLYRMVFSKKSRKWVTLTH